MNESNVRATWETLIVRSAFIVVMVIVGLVVPARVLADEVRVTSEQWERIRTVGEFVTIPGLKQLIMQMNDEKKSILDIHYPGGEGGQLWARQFQNRLVALGLGSNRIQLVQGVSSPGELQINIGTSK